MKVKEGILGIAIIVLTIFVTYYGVSTIFPKPNFEDYCKSEVVNRYINNSAQCEAEGGIWNPTIGAKVPGEPAGYCDLYTKCSQEFTNVDRARSKKVFFVALPIGLIIIILGAFFFGIEAVGAGLMGGGVGTLIYGAGVYWPYSQNWIRFLMSLVGLVVLIWFIYYFSKRNEKKGKKKR
jgi:hypothetical protein